MPNVLVTPARVRPRNATPFLVAALGLLIAGCETATEPDTGNGVSQITLSVSATTLRLGDSVQITAVPRDSTGALVTGATVTWTSSDNLIATVTSSGYIKGVGAGSTLVHAKSGTADVTVAVTVVAGFGTEFAIANSATVDEDFSGMIAFDGTNYLVPIQPRTSGTSNVEAQRVSVTGTLVGSRIVVPGRTGDPAKVAFDGTNYLLAFADHTSPNTTPPIAGQFVSAGGTLVGSLFTLMTGTGQFTSAVGLAFGGGTYFLSYVRETGTTGSATMTTYGRLVSITGTLGSELTMSANTSEGFNSTAFDGTRFLTVYTDGSTVRGRFVTTAGVMSAEITIYTTPVGTGLEPVVTVGFNGTNYMVTIARHGTSTGADAYAQIVTPAGANVGSLVTIAADPAIDEFALGAVGSGSNFLVSYMDNISSASAMRVRARFVSGTGAALGSGFTLATLSGGKSPLGGVMHYNGTKYFLLLQRGVPSASDPSNFGAWTQTDIFGALLTVPAP